MDDSAGPAEGDSPSEPRHSSKLPEVIVIAEKGDVILDVTFHNSTRTVRAARKSMPKVTLGNRGDPSPPMPQARIRRAFRVDHAILKKHSMYFEKLLGDPRFNEAKDIERAFASLSVANVKPEAADAAELPWIKIEDDDDATHYAHRDGILADLLRILHGRDIVTKQITMSFVTTLAVFADRFDCTVAVSKYVATGLKFKWPLTSRKSVRDEEAGMSRQAENILRQKILVSWLLNQPGKFGAATRELIVNGSCRWSSFDNVGDYDDRSENPDATWWYLQDGLEQELQYRRQCILNTIASVQRHFLGLYTSRERQCKLGYDSSAACDSYQLGEMFKFLVNRDLMFLVDFSPASLDSIADTSLLPIDSVISTLRQCPSYQIDKNHTNCGLRTRITPIFDFIQGLLSANSIPISRTAWKANREATAWMPHDSDLGHQERPKQWENKPFRYTRSLAGDQRLRYENAMGADKFARDVFTATSWDWSAEDQLPDRVSTTPRWFVK